MVTVVVFGQNPEPVARLTAAALSARGAVALRTFRGIESTGSGSPEFLVDAARRLDRLLISRSVLVLADQTAPRRPRLSEDTIVVACSDNRRMRRALSGYLNPVVTCGTGVRDTLTLSSLSPHRAVLCLQRELPTVSGLWLEPAEFAVTHSQSDLPSLMLAAGAAAVCGWSTGAEDMVIEPAPGTTTAPITDGR